MEKKEKKKNYAYSIVFLAVVNGDDDVVARRES